MATSYIGYQANGFWCQDSVLEGWLAFAVLELEGRTLSAPWMHEVQQEWTFYAQAGVIGAIDLTLDYFLATAERKTWMVALMQAVQKRFVQLGDTVSVALLNPLLPKGTYWVEDPPTSLFLAVGERLVQLLEGRLLTNESSPLDYL
jgi:hypothetical protein